MGFNYDFKADQPDKQEKTNERGQRPRKFAAGKMTGNKTLIAALIVLVALMFIGVSASVSGYTTYRESITKQLEYTVQELADTAQQKEQCSANLFSVMEKETACRSDVVTKTGELSSCQSQRTDAERLRTEAQTQVNTCTAEKSEIEQRYQETKEQLDAQAAKYDTLARSAVRSVCCSISDVVGGNTKHWGIADNKIVCADAGRTVNCGTGETDFS